MSDFKSTSIFFTDFSLFFISFFAVFISYVDSSVSEPYLNSSLVFILIFSVISSFYYIFSSNFSSCFYSFYSTYFSCVSVTCDSFSGKDSVCYGITLLSFLTFIVDFEFVLVFFSFGLALRFIGSTSSSAAQSLAEADASFDFFANYL